MKARSAILQEPAQRAARLVAVALIDEALDRWQSLQTPFASTSADAPSSEDAALHAFRVAARRLRTWLKAFGGLLDEAVDPALRKRLSRAMRATNADRDAQVHRRWLDQLSGRPRLPDRVRRGIALLLAHDDAAAPQAVPATPIPKSARLDKALRKMRKRLRAKPSETMALTRSPESAERFGVALAARVAATLLALRGQLAQVHSAHDEAAAHQARLCAKRLRYLLDPIRKRAAGAARVQRLTQALQDDLGKLHDLQTLRQRVEEAMRQAAVAWADARAARVTDAPGSPDVEGTFADLRGLEALLRRVMTAKRRLFAVIAKRWLGEGAPKRTALVDAGEALVAALSPPTEAPQAPHVHAGLPDAEHSASPDSQPPPSHSDGGAGGGD